MITRTRHLQRLKALLSRHRVLAILGARQVGKTTLARQLVARTGGRATVFDLEDPEDLARLSEPMTALRPLKGLVVIDEVQRRPELFPILRVLVDRPGCPTRFLVLGSASPDLLRQTSESLAGRIAYYELRGFDLEEVGPARADRLWVRGAFPRTFLARSDGASFEWRREFIRTFLERDLPQLGIQVPSTTMRRFWTMLAHSHGQVWNSSAFGRSFGVADTTVRRYLDILTTTFVVRQLPPWYENLRKRQVKAPKVYFTDSGLLHALLGLENPRAIGGHPVVGASWEGFGLEAVISRLAARPEECFFWATYAGAELDLLVVRGGRRWGFEFKRTDAPRVTASIRSALADLELERLDIIYPGERSFPLGERVRAVALRRLLTDLAPLR